MQPILKATANVNGLALRAEGSPVLLLLLTVYNIVIICIYVVRRIVVLVLILLMKAYCKKCPALKVVWPHGTTPGYKNSLLMRNITACARFNILY